MERSRRRRGTLYDRGRARRLAWVSAVSILFLMIATPCGQATPLSVRVGLGGVFVPGLPTTLHLSVEPYGTQVDGALWVVEQQVGDPWRGEAVMQYRFPAEDTDLDAVIPIYDFTYPLTARLVGEDRNAAPLAEATLNLRPLRKAKPYSLVIGSWPAVSDLDSEAEPVLDVAVSDLSDRWWGYAGIDTIWMGTASSASSAIPTLIWEAIERWVVAGGRLIVATGTSFYLIDSPELRELLPIRSPTLVEDRLRGDLKPGSELHRIPLQEGSGYESETQPLVEETGASETSWEIATSRGAFGDAVELVVQRYGAGLVAVVDRRADELSDQTITDLQVILDDHPYEPPLGWLSGAGEIRSMTLQRPGYPTTVLIGLLTLGGFVWIVFGGFFAGTRRLLAIGVLVVIASVWSGFHVNVRNRSMSLYAEKTILYIDGAVGIAVDRVELFAMATCDGMIPPPWAGRGSQRRGGSTYEGGVAVAQLPLELGGQRWDATWVAEPEGGLLVQSDRGDRRDVVFLSDTEAPLQAVYTGDERVTVSNPGSALAWAIAVVDGEFYDLGGLPRGESSIQLEGAVPPGEAVWGTSFDTIGTELESRFQLSEGAWLIAGTSGSTYERWGEATAKVRTTEVHIVAAELAG